MQKKEKKAPVTSEITMKTELKKVIWPTGKQTVKNTAITLAFVLFISIILILLDLGFNKLSEVYYESVLGIEGHEHQTIISGDDISGDLAEILKDLTSGDKSGETSGEVVTVSGEQAE